MRSPQKKKDEQERKEHHHVKQQPTLAENHQQKPDDQQGHNHDDKGTGVHFCLPFDRERMGTEVPTPLLVMGHVAARCLAAAPAGPSGVRRGPATEVLLLATLIEPLVECYVHDLADRVLP